MPQKPAWRQAPSGYARRVASRSWVPVCARCPRRVSASAARPGRKPCSPEPPWHRQLKSPSTERAESDNGGRAMDWTDIATNTDMELAFPAWIDGLGQAVGIILFVVVMAMLAVAAYCGWCH